MKQLRTLNLALQVAFWTGFFLCILGLYFTMLHWPFASNIRSIGYALIAVSAAISPFLLKFQTKIARIQLTLLYWGIALTFGILEFKRTLRLNGVSHVAYKIMLEFALLMLLSSAALYLYLLFTGQKKSGIPSRFLKLPPLELTDADVENYPGLYINKDLPLNISISKNMGQLTAQATDQQPFPLQAIGAAVFRHEAAGLVMEFSTVKRGITLYQHGGVFWFEKV